MLALILLRCRSQEFKELEIVVLRHELEILRRQAARPELRPADRAFLARRVHKSGHVANTAISSGIEFAPHRPYTDGRPSLFGPSCRLTERFLLGETRGRTLAGFIEQRRLLPEPGAALFSSV